MKRMLYQTSWLRWGIALLLAGFAIPQVIWAQQIVRSNDPSYEKQWALQTIGAECAWQHTTGDRSITVAVIDSGVDLTHPDLVGHLRDDGFDFIDFDEDPSDENGHGTHVAGIVAATLNNAEGITGLAPDVQILPIRVLDAEGSGSNMAVAFGIRYAAEQGADILNLSLGATLMLSVDDVSPEIEDAILFAQEQGALVVVAAGNDYVPLPNAVGGANEDVVVVAATNARDLKTQFSNSGPWVDVSAPGEHILSTMPTYEVFLTSDALPAEERFSRNYDYMSGTSQATPYVSALAALLWSANPDWTADQVLQAIKEGAVDIYDKHPEQFAEMQVLGAGRIDACASFGGPLIPIPERTDTAEPVDMQFALIGIGACVILLALVLAMLILVVMRRRKNKAQVPAPAGGYAQPQQQGYVPPQQQGYVPPQQQGYVPPQQQGYVPPQQQGYVPPQQQGYVPPQQQGYVPPQQQGYVPPQQQGYVPPQQQGYVPPMAGAPYNQQPSWGRLVIVSGPLPPRTYDLVTPEIIVGRAEGVTIQLSGDGTVSRRHARITRQGGQVVIEDLGSAHGTFVNGQPLTSAVLLRPGDILRIGQTSLRFEV
jgi:Subtilisin-like serine proteases